jgi:hypothetical protein
MFSALVRGAIFLRLQPNPNPPDFVLLSNLLAVLIAAASIILVLDGFRGWHGHRKKLSQVAGKDESGQLIIPPPNLRVSAIGISTMMFVIGDGSDFVLVVQPASTMTDKPRTFAEVVAAPATFSRG